MKPFWGFLHSEPQSFKAPKVREITHNKTLYLFKLLLLLIQWGAVQLQQRGGDAHRQVVGVHLVGVSALDDVMEDAHEMLQEEFVRHRELVYHPEGGRKKRKENRKKRLAWCTFFIQHFFPLFNRRQTKKKRSGLCSTYMSDIVTPPKVCQTPFKMSPIYVWPHKSRRDHLSCTNEGTAAGEWHSLDSLAGIVCLLCDFQSSLLGVFIVQSCHPGVIKFRCQQAARKILQKALQQTREVQWWDTVLINRNDLLTVPLN